jgi:hypothetical protein
MASKRCLPTRFFKDADIMNVSKDTQLILVGLVLLADDEGRELAHPKLLSREIDYPPEQIESSLQELVENDLVVLYQVGRHHYYSLTRWSQWQTINSQKMTPSKYPAPPHEDETSATTTTEGTAVDETTAPTSSRKLDELPPSPSENTSQKSPEIPSISQGKDGEHWERQTQLNLSESKLSQSNVIEDEGEAQPPPNIVPFPAAHTNDAVDEPVFPENRVIEVTNQVAAILKIPLSDGLERVVADYLGDPSLSLLGEADAAREWIEDPRRNRKRQQLTPVFFRRWLKREHEAVQRGYAPSGAFLQKTPHGTRPPSVQTGSAFANGIGPPDMQVTTASVHAGNPYQAFVSARAQAVLRHAMSRLEEARREATP